jgi:lipopolysaccharide transport system ATP-binding protein
VDEVLAVGDEGFQEKCEKQIEKFRLAGKTIIFVSHSADTVKEICDRACVGSRANDVIGKAAEAIERYHQLLGQ